MKTLIVQCDACVTEHPADYEYTGSKIDLRWLCSRHVTLIKHGVDPNPDNYKRVEEVREI